MNFETILNEVFSLNYFNDKPPVLIDIGASGEIHPEWKLIAKHSICIAFDADTRDFNNSETNSDNFLCVCGTLVCHHFRTFILNNLTNQCIQITFIYFEFL